MTNSVVSNPITFSNGLDQSYRRFERRFKMRMRRLMEAGMVRLIRRTPVHTGQAVMNYVASAGTPFGGGVSNAPKPVEPTNKLALGAERLRGPAEAKAMATLAQVRYDDPFTTYWIVNRTPHIGGLEAGELPEEPFTPRSPQGMFGVTLQELISLLESNAI